MLLHRGALSADTKQIVLQELLRCSGEEFARGAVLLLGDANGSAGLRDSGGGEVTRAYHGLRSSSEWRRVRSNRATRGAAAQVSCSATPACCACPVEESFTFRSPLACLPLVVLAYDPDCHDAEGAPFTCHAGILAHPPSCIQPTTSDGTEQPTEVQAGGYVGYVVTWMCGTATRASSLRASSTHLSPWSPIETVESLSDARDDSVAAHQHALQAEGRGQLGTEDGGERAGDPGDGGCHPRQPQGDRGGEPGGEAGATVGGRAPGGGGATGEGSVDSTERLA